MFEEFLSGVGGDLYETLVAGGVEDVRIADDILAETPPLDVLPDYPSWPESPAMSEESGDDGRTGAQEEQTRGALRDEALRQFADKGFGPTRIADIAEGADVSERTFFRYFDSKEDAALGALADWLNRWFDAIEELPDEMGPVEAVGAVLRQAEAGRFPFGSEELRDVVAYLAYPEVQLHLAVIIDGMRRRLIVDFARRSSTDPGDAYPRVLASVITGGMHAVMESWLLSGVGKNAGARPARSSPTSARVRRHAPAQLSLMC